MTPRLLPRRIIHPRQSGYPDLPPLPNCGNVCITNQSTLESQNYYGCAFSDTICHCSSASYMQPLYNCFAASCSHNDSVASHIYMDAICASVGATTVSGLTTPTTQEQRTSSTRIVSITSSSPPSSPSTITILGNVSTAPTSSRTGPSITLSRVPPPTYSLSAPAESSNDSASSTGPLVGLRTSPASNTSPMPDSSLTTSTGLIAAGVFAGVIALALLLVGLWLLRRRKRQPESPVPVEFTDQSSITGLIAERGHDFYPSTKHTHNLTLADEPPYRIPVPGEDDADERQRRLASTVVISGENGDEERRGTRANTVVMSGEDGDDERRQTRASTMTQSTEPPPPAYQPSPPGCRLTGGRRAGTASSGTEDPFTSIRESLDGAAEARIYDAEINQFCTANRDIISSKLEQKLRAAHWLPTDDPSEIPAEYWRDTYGVEFFELKRIQQAYARGRTAPGGA